MPWKLYLCGMSLDKGPIVTDALEAIRALREELASVKDELASRKRFCANFQILHRKNRTF